MWPMFVSFMSFKFLSRSFCIYNFSCSAQQRESSAIDEGDFFHFLCTSSLFIMHSRINLTTLSHVHFTTSLIFQRLELHGSECVAFKLTSELNDEKFRIRFMQVSSGHEKRESELENSIFYAATSFFRLRNKDLRFKISNQGGSSEKSGKLHKMRREVSSICIHLSVPSSSLLAPMRNSRN